MELKGQGINNTYIVKSLIEETEFIQRWETGAVFSPNTFYLDLVKSEKLSRMILDRSDVISEKLMNLQNIRNHSLLRTIEFGEYNKCFFTIQQKITGTNLYGIFDDGKKLSSRIIIKIMNDLLTLLVAFENRGICHNLLSSRSLWFPENFEVLGSVFISDTLLFYLLSFSSIDIKSHFNNLDPCISTGGISGNEYISDMKNDLFSFGSIFYYLITGGNIFQNKDEIDYSLIPDISTRNFLHQLLGKEMKIQTATELRESFTSVFEKELSIKQTEIVRDYSSSEVRMYSTNLKNITYESFKKTEIDMVEEDVEFIELFEEDSVDSPSVSDKVNIVRKTPVEFAHNIVKTVFGFFSRFGRNISKSAKEKNRNITGVEKNPRNSKEINNSIKSPTGDLQHVNDNQSETRLRKIFKDLASHYTIKHKKRITNAAVKNLEFNRRNSNLSDQIDNHEEINTLLQNRKYTKKTVKSDFSSGNSIPSKNKRTDLFYGDQMERIYDVSSITTPSNNYSDNEKENIHKMPTEPVPDFEEPIYKNQNPEVINESEYTSVVEPESELEEVMIPESHIIIPEDVERIQIEKPSLWRRFLMFIKKNFKFIK